MKKGFEQFEEHVAFVSKLNESVMTKEDWMIMKSLHLFLEHFFVVTKRVLGLFLSPLTISSMKYMDSISPFEIFVF